MRNLGNSVGVTIGWWACILGAVHGYPWAGPVVVGLHLTWHVALSDSVRHQLVFLGLATVIGLLLDGLLYLTGTVAYPTVAAAQRFVPIWMVALWPNFATTLTTSLSFLRNNLVLSAVVGAIAGPAAYWGGNSLGAIVVDGAYGYVTIGGVWALVIPILATLFPKEPEHVDRSIETEAAA